MENPMVVDTMAKTRQHRASVGYLWRKEMVVKEPKKEKLSDKIKAWNIDGLFLNRIVGTRFPSIFWYGNWISPKTVATDTHNINFSTWPVSLYGCILFPYISMALILRSKRLSLRRVSTHIKYNARL